jgi:hypothetical protein
MWTIGVLLMGLMVAATWARVSTKVSRYRQVRVSSAATVVLALSAAARSP